MFKFIKTMFERNVSIKIDWDTFINFANKGDNGKPVKVDSPGRMDALAESLPRLVIENPDTNQQVELITGNEDDIIEIIATARVYHQLIVGVTGMGRHNDEMSLLAFEMKVRSRSLELLTHYAKNLQNSFGISPDDIPDEVRAEFDRIFNTKE